jgi:ribonuclease T1
MSSLAKRLIAVVALLVGLAPWVFAQGDRTIYHALLGYSAEQGAGRVAGLPGIGMSDLPPEARATLALIKQGGPFPYARDGIPFANREGLLPPHRRGYYREYTVKTPGSTGRGARRIIAGAKSEFYYTDDHYRTFRHIKEWTVKRLSNMLADSTASGVYLLEESSPVPQVEIVTRERGLAFFHLEGRDIHDKDHFLKEAALALGFPEYFGNNWDAFADCLMDMSWHEAEGFVVLYNHFDTLTEDSPQAFATVLDIFRESTDFWRDQGKAVFVLLCGKKHLGAELQQILI